MLSFATADECRDEDNNEDNEDHDECDTDATA